MEIHFKHHFKGCRWVNEEKGGKWLAIHTQDADGGIGRFKGWLNNKCGHTRSVLQSYAKEWQYRRNRPNESM